METPTECLEIQPEQDDIDQPMTEDSIAFPFDINPPMEFIEEVHSL